MTNNFEEKMNAMMETIMENMMDKVMDKVMSSMMASFGINEKKTSAPAEIEPEKSIDPTIFFAEEKPAKKHTEPVYNYDGISLVLNGWKTHCYTDKSTGEKHFYKRVEVYFNMPVSSTVYTINLNEVKSKWNGMGCKDKDAGRYGFAFKDKESAQNFFMNYHIITK